MSVLNLVGWCLLQLPPEVRAAVVGSPSQKTFFLDDELLITVVLIILA